jgi:hypothetical protein
MMTPIAIARFSSTLLVPSCDAKAFPCLSSEIFLSNSSLPFAKTIPQKKPGSGISLPSLSLDS